MTSLYFNITFSPLAVQNYEFILPITMRGLKETKGLRRKIICKATQRPRIVFLPSVINFTDVIITKQNKD